MIAFLRAIVRPYLAMITGTALGVVGLGVTLTTLIDVSIAVIHDPSVPKIEWYVNGVLKGTQSTAANIPSGMSGGPGTFVHSILNGPTVAVSANSQFMLPKIWQAGW